MTGELDWTGDRRDLDKALRFYKYAVRDVNEARIAMDEAKRRFENAVRLEVRLEQLVFELNLDRQLNHNGKNE